MRKIGSETARQIAEISQLVHGGAAAHAPFRGKSVGPVGERKSHTLLVGSCIQLNTYRMQTFAVSMLCIPGLYREQNINVVRGWLISWLVMSMNCG